MQLEIFPSDESRCKRNSDATSPYRMWTSPISSFIALRLVQTSQGLRNVKTVGPCGIFEYEETHECITKHTECYSSRETFSCTSQMCFTFTRHVHALVKAYLQYSHEFTNNYNHLRTSTVVSNCKASDLRMAGDRCNPQCHRMFRLQTFFDVTQYLQDCSGAVA